MVNNDPSKTGEKIGVGIIGGSGYIGAELLRYALIHPRLEIRWVTANTRVGEEIAAVLPNLGGFARGTFLPLEEAERRLGEVRAVFVSLPHNQSQTVIPALVEKAPGTVFIDMAGDFRTNDLEGYRRYYGREHAAPQWLPRFIYGLTEFQRDRLRSARLIANPGCFATALDLSLAPLAAAGRLKGDVFISAVTGSSGSGNKPTGTTHHPERAANFRAYKVLAHQHLLEVEAFLRTLTRDEFHLGFVPHSGPFVRGIFTTLFLRDIDLEELEGIFHDAYGGEALISVIRGSPELRWVQGTPRAVIGLEGREGRAVVFSVTDNLGKGAAGQAIQNLNLALGIPETEGLQLPGGFV